MDKVKINKNILKLTKFENQRFTFKEPIKDVYIGKGSDLFGLVLLENGDVFSILLDQRDYRYKKGIKVDENCTYIDFILDPQNTTPIFKTDNNLHYFLRYKKSDLPKMDVKLYHQLYHKIVPTPNEFKNNKLIPYYIEKKYKKNIDSYFLTFLTTEVFFDEENNEVKLKNTSDEYVIYDYEKKILYLELDDKKIIIQLKSDFGNDEERLLNNTLYNKIVYKNNGNYVIFKGKGRTFVTIFTNKNWRFSNKEEKEKLFEYQTEVYFRGNLSQDFSRGEIYLSNNWKNKKDERNEKGFSIFNDQYLPDYMNYNSEYRSNDDILTFGYIEKKLKLLIPKSCFKDVIKKPFKRI